MKIEAFDWKRHHRSIEKWLRLRKLDPFLSAEIPCTGLIAIEKGEWVAAGFIRRLELSAVAQLDGYITNPKADPEIRNLALDALTEALIHKAKSMHLKTLHASTIEPHILERSFRFGFRKLPHVLIGLDLEGVRA